MWAVRAARSKACTLCGNHVQIDTPNCPICNTTNLHALPLQPPPPPPPPPATTARAASSGGGGGGPATPAQSLVSTVAAQHTPAAFVQGVWAGLSGGAWGSVRVACR
jgi:hypothetical protein